MICALFDNEVASAPGRRNTWTVSQCDAATRNVTMGLMPTLLRLKEL